MTEIRHAKPLHCGQGEVHGPALTARYQGYCPAPVSCWSSNQRVMVRVTSSGAACWTK